MESYALQEALRYLSGSGTGGLERIQLPFYVFDSSVLTEFFSGYYTLPRKEPTCMPQSNFCSHLPSILPYIHHTERMRDLQISLNKLYLNPSTLPS